VPFPPEGDRSLARGGHFRSTRSTYRRFSALPTVRPARPAGRTDPPFSSAASRFRFIDLSSAPFFAFNRLCRLQLANPPSPLFARGPFFATEGSRLKSFFSFDFSAYRLARTSPPTPVSPRPVKAKEAVSFSQKQPVSRVWLHARSPPNERSWFSILFRELFVNGPSRLGTELPHGLRGRPPSALPVVSRESLFWLLRTGTSVPLKGGARFLFSSLDSKASPFCPARSSRPRRSHPPPCRGGVSLRPRNRLLHDLARWRVPLRFVSEDFGTLAAQPTSCGRGRPNSGVKRNRQRHLLCVVERGCPFSSVFTAPRSFSAGARNAAAAPPTKRGRFPSHLAPPTLLGGPQPLSRSLGGADSGACVCQQGFFFLRPPTFGDFFFFPRQNAPPWAISCTPLPRFPRFLGKRVFFSRAVPFCGAPSLAFSRRANGTLSTCGGRAPPSGGFRWDSSVLGGGSAFTHGGDFFLARRGACSSLLPMRGRLFLRGVIGLSWPGPRRNLSALGPFHNPHRSLLWQCGQLFLPIKRRAFAQKRRQRVLFTSRLTFPQLIGVLRRPPPDIELLVSRRRIFFYRP